MTSATASILDELSCAAKHGKRVKRITITRSMAGEITSEMLRNLRNNGGFLTPEELAKEVPPLVMAPKRWAILFGVPTYVRPDIVLIFEKEEA